MKSLWLKCLLIVGGLPAWAASPATPDRVRIDSAFLTDLVEEAGSRHLQLRAFQMRRDAAQRAVSGVRLWEDPMVKFGGSVANTPGPDLEMEGDLLYEVEQSLPLFGKATAQRREAEASASVAEAELEYRYQMLRRDVVQAAHTLALAEAVLSIGEQDLELVERMLAYVRERQVAGLDDNVDFLRLESERQRRQLQLETDRLQRDFERATFNRLLARPQDGPWPVLEAPGIAPPIPFSEQLVSLALRNEPRLAVLRLDARRAEAGIEVARRSHYPNVSLSVGGRQWSGSGAFREGMFGVGVNVPWFNRSRYRADLDRDRALAGASQAEVLDYELEVRRELFRVWTRIDAARREALLYQEQLLPRWELVVQNTVASWSVGRGPFLDVLDARRELTEARMTLAQAVAEQHRMLAELVTCCGVAELDALEMLGAGNSEAPPSPTAPAPGPLP